MVEKSMSPINLSGSEIAVLKALGLSGASIQGDVLKQRVGGFEDAELLDTLQGLIQIGYVASTREGLRTVKEMENAVFKINPSYLKILQEAMDPRQRQQAGKKKRRQRRT